MRTPAASAALLILVGLMVGCARPAGPSQAATPSHPAVAAPTNAPAAMDQDQVQDYPVLDTQPWAQTSQDALDTAAAAVGVYLDPASPTWVADLSGFLSPSALRVYEAVDPAVVPTGEVTGGPTVTQEHDGVLATVRVPTSIGDLDVLMTRGTTETGGWEVEQIIPVDVP